MDSKQTLSSRRIFLYIFLAGFIVRLLLGAWLKTNIDNDCATIIARNLLAQKVYSLNGIDPTALRTPGFPFILAFLMALFTEYAIPLIVLRAIIGAINACLCAWLGMKIFNRRSGIISGALYTIIPYLAQQEAISELAFVTFGLLAGLCLLYKAYNIKKITWLVPSALMFSFSYLIRPDIGIIPFFISFSILIVAKKAKRPLMYLTAAILFAAVFLAGISPWVIRNKITFGRWYFGQTFFWHNFYKGNHTRTFEIYPASTLDSFFYSAPKEYPVIANDPFEQEDWYRKQALVEIGKLGPKNILKYSFKKFIYLWHIRLIPYKKHLIDDPHTGKPVDVNRSITDNLIFSIPYTFLVIFALFGCWQERKKPQLLIFILGLLLSFSLPYTINFAYSRYTVQVYFILIILASRGLVSLLKIE